MKANETTIPVVFRWERAANLCACGREVSAYGTCPVCGTENLDEEDDGLEDKQYYEDMAFLEYEEEENLKEEE